MARSTDDRALGGPRSGCCTRDSRAGGEGLPRSVFLAGSKNQSLLEPATLYTGWALAEKRTRRHRTEMTFDLRSRAVSEFLGTAFLLAAVVGSGIMGERLSGGNVAMALLANTLSTGAILMVLILTLGP